tara:strand:+ start:25 stop:321 length:297 start_codon:yes stop_codon:yes gene_type:complete
MKHLTITLLTLLVLGGCISNQGRISILEAESDFSVCIQYFQPKLFGSARSQEWRYDHYKSIVNEIDKRNLDCKKFPDFDKKTSYFRERIEKFETEGVW